MRGQQKGSFLANSAKVGLISLIFGISSAHAFDDAQVPAKLDAAINYLESQQRLIDGSWCEKPSFQYICTVSVVQALSLSHVYSPAYYGGVAWLESHAAGNVDFVSRKVLTLSNHGNNLDSENQYLVNAKENASTSGIGLSRHYAPSPLDTAWALQASIRLGDDTLRYNFRTYLLQARLTRGDGGWPIGQYSATSSYWATAESVLALKAYPLSDSGVNAAINGGMAFLAGMTTDQESVILARAALAVHGVSGITTEVDQWATELISRQEANGGWGDIYTTASAVQALAAISGLTASQYTLRVELVDQTLRGIVNQQLGKNAFDNLTRGEMLRVTNLDLRQLDVDTLSGLEYATGITEIKVNRNTDVSALAAQLNVTILVDSDGDDIADDVDNCPDFSSPSQANLDGDAFGDVCDPDIDGDSILNDWELANGLNPYNISDGAADWDGDGLINLGEFQQNSDIRIKDTDGDGADDLAEFNARTDPRDPDSDGDEMPDGFEITHSPVLDPLFHDSEADPDRDELTNFQEYGMGTNPTNRDTDGDALPDNLDNEPLEYSGWLIPVLHMLL